MSQYLPPLNTTATIFNVADYNYQDNAANYDQAVLKTTTQSIAGTKTFVNQIVASAGISLGSDLIANGATLNTTEMSYLDGITSAVQTQINTKAPTANSAFTGTMQIPQVVDVVSGAPNVMIVGKTAQSGNTHTNSYYSGYQVINAVVNSPATLDKNCVIGYQAWGGGLPTTSSGANAQENTYVGYRAGFTNTDGGRNTAVGATSLNVVTTGSGNTSIGRVACLSLTTGTNNCGVGSGVLQFLTTGINNTASGVGSASLSGVTGATNCSFYGYLSSYFTGSSSSLSRGSAYGADSQVGSANSTALGSQATCNTTSANSTAIGCGATCTGTYGVALGSGSTAGANSIVLGRSAGQENVCCPVLTTTGPTGTVSVYADASGNLTKTSSDQRLKQNIELLDNDDCLSKINELLPKQFEWKSNNAIDAGFVAQDVQQTSLDYLVNFNSDGPKDANGDPVEGEDNYRSLCYEKFLPFMVGAIKSLSAKCNALTARVEALENI
jgi:Chaperone of endosialidase/Lower baseplate protein N-terminal domain